MSSYKTLNTLSLPVESFKLLTPPLEEIVKVLSKYLPSCFEYVNVEVSDCPDLQKAPYNLASSGLNGKTTLIDIGGPPYLLPTVDREKVYTFDKLNKICGDVTPAFFIGAGAGPFPHAGSNCEMVANLTLPAGDLNGDVNIQTRIVKIVNRENDEFKVEILPANEARFALLGNFFLSQGKPGKVVKIECKKRKGDDNIITAIRLALKNKYGSQPVGMGGVFLLNAGKAKQHVMPDFSSVPLNSEEELNKWLCFFEMDAPLIAVGTLISDDPGLDLRVQHFHSFNANGKGGGHYHYDTTPDVVEYTAYLTTADFIYRIDKPLNTHQFGRD